MNTLIEAGVIKETIAGSNFSYVISNKETFLATEYKVLQSQSEDGFVKCMKMLYNGKIQLFYLTQSLKSLASLIPSIEAEGFLTVVSNLLSDIIDVKHNGFLVCQSIDIGLDKVFIDPATYKVFLTYLPISSRMYDSVADFENELRTSLIRLISDVPAFRTPRLMQFASDLSNGTLTIEDLQTRIKGGSSYNINNEYMRKSNVVNNLRIIAMNTPMRVEMVVTKNEYIIGKKSEICDGVLGFSKMISRVHCKICRIGGQYTIMDLQSANGTYVNKQRLQPNQPFPIKNGDIIRLANIDFQVNIG